MMSNATGSIRSELACLWVFLACLAPELQAQPACPALDDVLDCSSAVAASMNSADPSRLDTYSCGTPTSGLVQLVPDRVYAFTCQADGPVTIGLSGQACDFDLYVLDTSCDPGTGCLVGDTATSVNSSAVTFDCVAGTEYAISVEGAGFDPSATGPRQCFDGDGFLLETQNFGAGTGCPEQCDDSLDNDGDGAFDCDDSDCLSDAVCGCDTDGDGFLALACGGDDCDDTDPDVNPGASEIWYDGVDQDCDGASDFDQDFDGFDSDLFSGSDCDDMAPAVNPDAAEICGNGVDENCDDFGLLSDDEDLDGCSTAQELALVPPTDACEADSDGDLLLDGEELGPNCQYDPFERDPLDDDTDDDQLPDGEEPKFGTDELDADTDDDGVPDGEEAFVLGTNPISFDSDFDFLGDGLESGLTSATPGGVSDGSGVSFLGTAAGWQPDLDPGTATNPLDIDSDGDFLIDGLEDGDRNGRLDPGESDPFDFDSDDDGLSDGAEDANRDGLLDLAETDPASPDSDGDALCDGARTDNDGNGIDPPSGCIGSEVIAGSDPRDTDSDDDGRLDGEETLTDPMDADSDDDGLADGEESTESDTDSDAQVDALDPDSDGDGLIDGVEAGRTAGTPAGNSDVRGLPYAGTDGFIPDADPATNTDPLDIDSDDDLLFDGIEDANFDGAFDAGETDPNDADTDDDLLLDGEEDLNANGTVDGTETDPLLFDTDDDGLGDGAEEAAGADPLDIDTDDDGLLDGEESLSDPADADTDDDGLSDAEEDTDGSGTVGPSETSPVRFDSDIDLLGDGLESGRDAGVPGGTSDGRGLPYAGTGPAFSPDGDTATITDPLNTDTDGDTLEDGAEDMDGDGFVDATETDPNLFDSDSDGVGDGEELFCGSDPLDDQSTIDCIVFNDGFES